MKPGKPRFIAGAVCPGCRIVDRLVTEKVEGVKRRRCVECGYEDEQSSGASPLPRTRNVPSIRDGTDRQARDNETTPVRLIDLDHHRDQ